MKARVIPRSVLTGLLVALTVTIIWIATTELTDSDEAGTGGQTTEDNPVGEQICRIHEFEGLCERFRKQYGSWPTNVDMIRAGLGVTSPKALTDVWGREYRFYLDTSGKHLMISSLGADGKPGGQGLDADYTLVLK